MTSERRCPTCERVFVRPDDFWWLWFFWGWFMTMNWWLFFASLFGPYSDPEWSPLFLGVTAVVAWLFYDAFRDRVRRRALFDRVRDRLAVV
jgi:hypothetical protein